MKKIIFALLASAATLSGMSMAHAEGAYVGAGVSASRYKFDVPNANGDDSGYKAAGKIFGGYEFDKTWGIEGGYTKFGDKDYSYTSKDGFSSKISTGSHAYYVAGKATMPINEQVGVFGKLGAARTKDKFTGTGAASGLSSGESKTGLYASVGAQYAINKNVSLTAEVEHYGKSADYGRKATAVSFGARYNF